MASGDSAWATQDPISRKRLNRDWIIGRTRFPMFDDDINEAVSVTAKSVAGTVLGTAASALYTVPSSGVAVTQVNTITIVNFSVTARVVNVYLVASGGSPAVSNQIFGDTLFPGQLVVLDGPWFLAASDSLQASAAAGSAVSLTGELLEFKTQPNSVTLKVVQGAALGTSSVTYYTVPGSGVRQALVLAVTLFNSHTAGLTPTVHRVPSGGSPSNATIVFSGPLLAKETAIFGPPLTLAPGDFMAALAGTAGLVAARFTILEAA